MEKVQFYNLLSEEYEHELDKSALDKLHKTPGLETVTKKFIEMGLEKNFFLQFSSSCMKCTPKTYPKELKILEESCQSLGLDKMPEMYVLANPFIGAQTVGVERSMIVLYAGAIDRLEDEEMRFLISHELGHIKSKHILFHQLYFVFPIIADIIGQATLGIGKLSTVAVQMALARWNRASDLTADRAGLLSCQDINVAYDCLMKMSGLPEKYVGKIKRKDFLEQLSGFSDYDFGVKDKFMMMMTMNMAKAINIVNQNTITRAAFLLKWYKGGEFSNLIERHLHRKNLGIEMKCYCPKCNKTADADDVFCAYCGVKIK